MSFLQIFYLFVKKLHGGLSYNARRAIFHSDKCFADLAHAWGRMRFDFRSVRCIYRSCRSKSDYNQVTVIRTHFVQTKKEKSLTMSAVYFCKLSYKSYKLSCWSLVLAHVLALYTEVLSFECGYTGALRDKQIEINRTSIQQSFTFTAKGLRGGG